MRYFYIKNILYHIDIEKLFCGELRFNPHSPSLFMRMNKEVSLAFLASVFLLDYNY